MTVRNSNRGARRAVGYQARVVEEEKEEEKHTLSLCVCCIDIAGTGYMGILTHNTPRYRV